MEDGSPPGRPRRKPTLAEVFGAEPQVTTLDMKGDVTEPLAEAPRELVPVTPGERLGRYVVLEQIGRGGMAVVYKAFDPELDRNIAMKVMFPADGRIHDDEMRGRFVREAQAMARVHHRNVIEVYDTGTVGERAYITMRLVDGSNARDWAREKRPWRDKLAAYVAAGRGLAAAHAAGLVHRDFKPSNILVSKDGAVYVTDFGLARLASQIDADAPTIAGSGGMLSSDITRTGAIAGTEGFIAPELYTGAPPDARSDQFAFCVALYVALFAQAPFVPRKTDQTDPPQALPDPDSEVPQWVRRIMRRGLAPAPADRFASVEELLDALERDPAVARRRLAVPAFGVAAVGVAVAFAVTRGGKSVKLCEGAEHNLDGVWDAAIRTKAEAAFGQSGLPYASNAWTTASTTLDDYARQWVTARTDACAATRIRGEQSEEVQSLRMLCLDRRLLEFGALTAQLAIADKKVVEKSPRAAAALTNLAICANVATLKEVPRPPDDPRVAQTTRALASSKALRDYGKFQDAMPLAKEAVTLADALDYAPLRAEAHYAVGRLDFELGDPRTAEDELMISIGEAERGHDDRTRAHAATGLVWVHGVMQDHYETALGWEKIAYGVIARLGGDTDLTLTVQNHHGGILFGQGKFDELLVQQKAYVEAHEKFAGPTHPETVLAIINYGSALAIHGDYNEAAAQYQRAADIYERTMGPHYFRVGLARNNLADILLQQGHAGEALPMARAATALIEEGRGPAHRETVASQFTVAAAQLATGDADGALAFIDAHLDSWRGYLQADPALLAEIVVVASRAHRATNHAERGLAMLDDMLVQLRKQPQPDAMLADVLAERGRCLLAQHQNAEAVTVLEEAVKRGTELHLRPVWLADAKLALARALHAVHGDVARETTLTKEAHAVFDHAGIPHVNDP